MSFNEMLLKPGTQISTLYLGHFGLHGGGRTGGVGDGWGTLLPSEGKGVSILIHCLVNFARGVDSSGSISSHCIFILQCNLLLSVKCETSTTIRALEQTRPINSVDVWCIQQEAITSQRYREAVFFQSKRLIWVSDSILVNSHHHSAIYGIIKQRGSRDFTQLSFVLRVHINPCASVMKVMMRWLHFLWPDVPRLNELPQWLVVNTKALKGKTHIALNGLTLSKSWRLK